MHILFCRKNQKKVLQEEVKDWAFEACSLTKETSSWFPLIGSLKMTCARSYAWFLNFYQMEGVLFVFYDMSYPNSLEYLRPVQIQ